jgi:hypothetical protein
MTETRNKNVILIPIYREKNLISSTPTNEIATAVPSFYSGRLANDKNKSGVSKF